jgi:hypothetical protein
MAALEESLANAKSGDGPRHRIPRAAALRNARRRRSA